MCNRVFVIDDYPINLKIAEMLIKKQGFFDKATSYSEAKIALDYMVSHKKNKEDLPDVILLDLNMPDMNGWQFLEKFENMCPLLQKSIDVFIVSSSIDDFDIQRARSYTSVKGFFSKPLNLHMLQDIATLRLASVG